ncbi:DNA-binding protein [Arcobacter sp. FW59]|nr:DNA-binding protein [Arcobacter sp. FW59]
MEELIITENGIKNKIYNIRGLQVMLDRDLAELYGVETKILNKAVNRNLNRFPERFRFQLTQEEFNVLRFQFGTSSLNNTHGGRRYLPFAFTEQGISMLSAVLRSDIAVDVSIKIIDTFVNMRNFLQNNASIFSRIETIEKRQISYELKNDSKVDFILNALEDKNLKPSEGIFYDGQIFDSYSFINDLLKLSKNEIILIDNYIDDTVFTIFSKYPNINFTIYTNNISKQLNLDFEKYQKQYKNITLKTFKNSHDRFLILDKKEIYHLGASLKDLGKKWFAFSKISLDIDEMINRLK